MDKSLGDILDYLDKHNLVGNTVVLFMSDNGGLSATAGAASRTPTTARCPAAKARARRRHPRADDRPLPRAVKPGSVCDEYLIIEDFFPTILDLAGVKGYGQIGGKLDGVSFVPLLHGQSGLSGGRALFWHYPNIWGPSGPGLCAFNAIRKGDWKYIYYHDPRGTRGRNFSTSARTSARPRTSQPPIRRWSGTRSGTQTLSAGC